MSRALLSAAIFLGGCTLTGADPFADVVVDFSPGQGAGYGQDLLPDVVLGSPEGTGELAGSLDVLSLGDQGSIVLELYDLPVVDGPGEDLLVFENAFAGWPETGEVSVSVDGDEWHTWTCAAEDADGGYPGCAGVRPVFASSTNGLDPTDPAQAGGDAFDLAVLGLDEAWFVRIVDTGRNAYAGDSGGFDLDAIASIH